MGCNKELMLGVLHCQDGDTTGQQYKGATDAPNVAAATILYVSGLYIYSDSSFENRVNSSYLSDLISSHPGKLIFVDAEANTYFFPVCFDYYEIGGYFRVDFVFQMEGSATVRSCYTSEFEKIVSA